MINWRRLRIAVPFYQQDESHINTLRPRQNGYPFSDNIFNSVILNENMYDLLKIYWSLLSSAQLTITCKVWDEITYPLPNFNGALVQV